jgi:hypothetical protein
MTFYQRLIAQILATLRRPDVEARHVEAYVRLAVSGTSAGMLDELTLGAFAREIRHAVDCIDAEGIDLADDLARSLGVA